MKAHCLAAAALCVLAGSVASASPTQSNLVVNTLSSGGVQSFPVALQAGDVFSVMTTPLVIPFEAPDTVIRVLDPNGIELIYNDDGGDGWANGDYVTTFGSALRVRAGVGGTYTVQVTGFPDFDFIGDHTEAGDYGYTTSIMGSGNGQFNDSATNGAPVGADPIGLQGLGSRIGLCALEAADLDYYSIRLSAGDVLSVMATPTRITFEAPDTVIGVFDSTGVFIFSNDDGGYGWDGQEVTQFGSALRFVTPTDGTYYIGVTGYADFEFTGDHAQFGPYGLTVSIVGPPNCPADWNNDGQVDFFDYLDFVADFANENADYNGDGQTDFFDYLDFVADFSVGCD